MVRKNAFDVHPNEARRLLNQYRGLMDFHIARQMSASCGIALGELERFRRTGNLETNRLPLLYRHIFGNVEPEQAEDYLRRLGVHG